jgi:single-strand selective monofunctional uracil DNA glycosylase
MTLLDAGLELRDALAGLKFSPPVAHVYNPLEYAWEAHRAYATRYGQGKKRVLFLGMNPGPFGMAQTGVPFGEIPAVRDWMGINEPVGHPPHEHPKRKIEGFACKRSEVSGRRLWGWIAQQFGTAENFFRECYVVNYCPLIFLEDTGRNRTPDKVPGKEMAPIEAACQRHLRRIIDLLDPTWLIGVGGFAEAKFQEVVKPGEARTITKISHPSPANPAANKDWAGLVKRQLTEAGVWKW